MTTTTSALATSTGGRLRVARTRGMLTGFSLIILGIWGGLIPFVGPVFKYAYTPDKSWMWTANRFWLSVLPAIAVILGGAFLLMTANRLIGVFGAMLAAAGGAWFVIGPQVGMLWHGPQGAAGTPVGGTLRQVVEGLGFFYGLGAVVLFLAAVAFGRMTVRGVRDVLAAERARERQLREEQAAARASAAPAGTSAPAGATAPAGTTEPAAGTVPHEGTYPSAEHDLGEEAPRRETEAGALHRDSSTGRDVGPGSSNR